MNCPSMHVRFIGFVAASFHFSKHSVATFFGAKPFSLDGIRQVVQKKSLVRASGTLAGISTETSFDPPQAKTAIPGILEKEEQPVRNPIDSTSSVLVVGGTRGIGLEFVRQCAKRGAHVIATYRDDDVPPSLSQLKEEFRDCTKNEDGPASASGTGSISGLRMDVSDEESVRSAALELQSRKGFRLLTHVVHSAGTYLKGTTFDGTSRGGRPPAPPVTKQIMMDTFLINAVGPLMVAQSFVPIMGSGPNATEAQRPVFAVLSSKVGSVHDNGSGGTYAYRASKSALNNICKSLSVDLAGEISVVVLHPGYVRTDMTGGNGLIDADESVAGMLRAVESTDATVGFRFVDYKAELIPW